MNIPRYLTITELGKTIAGMSPNTTRRYLKEMEASPRYKHAALYLNLETVRYSTLCFFDYLYYRAKLIDKNLSKFVPDYDPAQAARLLGEEYEKRGNT